MRQQGAERQDGARGGAEAKGGAGDEGETRDGEEATGEMLEMVKIMVRSMELVSRRRKRLDRPEQ